MGKERYFEVTVQNRLFGIDSSYCGAISQVMLSALKNCFSENLESINLFSVKTHEGFSSSLKKELNILCECDIPGTELFLMKIAQQNECVTMRLVAPTRDLLEVARDEIARDELRVNMELFAKKEIAVAKLVGELEKVLNFNKFAGKVKRAAASQKLRPPPLARARA